MGQDMSGSRRNPEGDEQIYHWSLPSHETKDAPTIMGTWYLLLVTCYLYFPHFFVPISSTVTINTLPSSLPPYLFFRLGLLQIFSCISPDQSILFLLDEEIGNLDHARSWIFTRKKPSIVRPHACFHAQTPLSWTVTTIPDIVPTYVHFPPEWLSFFSLPFLTSKTCCCSGNISCGSLVDFTCNCCRASWPPSYPG